MSNNEKNKVLILSGGNLSVEFLQEYLKKNTFHRLICVDQGLVWADKLKLPIDYIVGDFDTVPIELIETYKHQIKDGKKKIEIREFNPEKDYTDTQIGIELALEIKGDSIVILGATGTRIDHLLGNIHLLMKPMEKGSSAVLLDDYNKIYLINQSIKLKKSELYGAFLSIMPFTEQVTGVTLKGMKYPLDNYTLIMGESLGISNEVLEEEAYILLKEGILIVIEARDKVPAPISTSIDRYSESERNGYSVKE